ncbi:MAG TPA: hypothetical protein VHG89_08935 [Verrucomicrobiae bacterium]|nr:hypothetical protein [Verrucomicrobiae bacterium]
MDFLEEATEKQERDALEKYKELYTYSTEILLQEHERFNRADEKAAKYSTTFVFFLGIVAYFDKWILEKIKWPDFPLGLPQDWPLVAVGGLALFFSATGWFLTVHAIKLRPYKSRPLDKETLDFFDNQSLLNIYDSFSRRNIADYEENKNGTNKKLAVLFWAHRVMALAIALLVELTVMYCLYSWL